MAVPNLIEQFTSPNFTNYLFSLIIPFLIFFTLLLVVIKRTKIFGDGNFIYVLLSLGLTIMIYIVNPGNVFQFLVSYLFQIGVAGAVIALSGVIFILFWNLIKRGVRIADKLGKTDQQRLNDLAKEEGKLAQKFYKERDLGKRSAVANRIEEIRKEQRMLLIKAKRL